jgi:hypothetical protein
MSSQFFAWMAISAMLVGLFVPVTGHRSTKKDPSVADGRALAAADSPDGDGSGSDDSGSDDADGDSAGD